jgi:hypothetical protein
MNEEDRLHIYPVPAHDQLIIEHDLRGTGATQAQVRITNMLGTEVARFNVSAAFEGRIFWNTRSIAPGMYIVGLSDGNGPYRTRKAIIE